MIATAVPALAPASPARSGGMTRDDVVRLGQAGRPWDFLGVAAMALAQAPTDPGVRFLFAANLARLGLRTLALEELGRLPAEVARSGDVTALLAAVASLPDDRLDARGRLGVCRANVAALRSRGVDLGGALAAWEGGVGGTECFRALDGNVVRRVAGDGNALAWRGLRDDRVAATSASAGLADGKTFSRASVVEGVDPPWTLMAAWERTASPHLGHTPRIFVVQADEAELLEGLSLADLTPLIVDERVEWFVGAEASTRLRAALLDRLDSKLPDGLMDAPGLRRRCVPDVATTVRGVMDLQVEEAERLRARVDAIYALRDRAWWDRRYASAGPAQPLRAVLPTTLHSTFVRHAAADLAGAMGRAGVRARTLHERSIHDQLSAIAYLRAFAGDPPDLVVLINFTRASFASVIPANVPFVAWIQDALPHLFDASAGAAQGPLDFLAGHLFQDLFTKFGYPTGRTLPGAVVADATKFHDGPAGGAAAEHACEIAFVSHHGETPEAMQRRLAADLGAAAPVSAALGPLFDDVRSVVARAALEPPTAALRTAVDRRLHDALGAEPPARLRSMVLNNYALALADRVIRHETLAWAADLARERSWRLRVYGRGWERSPFAAFARPELAHGEALRASYLAAATHLHVSISAIVHQRPIECLLSGGLPLCRVHRDALAGPKTTAQLALAEREPDVVDGVGDRVGYIVADHPEAMLLASTLARLGSPLDGPVLWISAARRESHRRLGATLARDADANLLLVDMAETTFDTRDRLGALVTRATEEPAWRRTWSRAAAGRARTSLTHDAFARRLLAMIRSSLEAG